MTQLVHVFAGAKHFTVPAKESNPKLPLGAHVFNGNTNKWGKVVNKLNTREIVTLSLDRKSVV